MSTGSSDEPNSLVEVKDMFVMLAARWDSLESRVTDRSARSGSPSLSGLDGDNVYGTEGRDSFRGARRNVRVVSYIDNMLLLAHSEEAAARQMSAMKSVTMPSQNMEFLDVMVDTTSVEVCLPEQKLQKIRAEARSMTHLTTMSARAVARLIGKMSAASHVVSSLPLFYRHLQMLVSSTVNNRLRGDS